MNNNKDNAVAIHANRKANSVDRGIAEQVRLRRELVGLAEGECAEMLGISRRQLQKYESAENRIPASRLVQFSQVLEAPLSYFFERAAQPDDLKSDDNVLQFPLDNSVPQRETAKAERHLVLLFRQIELPQDRALLLQMAERLAGK